MIVVMSTALIMFVWACGDDDDGDSIQRTPDSTAAQTTQPPTVAAEDVFIANCARCHGQDAEGGFGPQLAGGAVVRAFPNADEQIGFVEGHALPPFREQLTEEEIRAVVEYTRSLQ